MKMDAIFKIVLAQVNVRDPFEQVTNTNKAINTKNKIGI
jgi:hypothetical protein